MNIRHKRTERKYPPSSLLVLHALLVSRMGMSRMGIINSVLIDPLDSCDICVLGLRA